jgi:hypothetical protein
VTFTVVTPSFWTHVIELGLADGRIVEPEQVAVLVVVVNGPK